MTTVDTDTNGNKQKRLLMKKYIGKLGGVLRVDKILLWIRSGNLEREENLQMKMEDLKQYKCLLSDSGNGDEEVFYILNFEPSGIRFPRQAAITLPQLPGKGNLFIFHGTADLDGFIEWEDYTSKVEILRIGNVDCLSLGLTSFCKYAIGVSTKRYVKRTLLDRFNNRYYARATTLFQRLNCLPLSFDCCVLFESQKVHAEDSKTSEANVLTKKNSYSRCEVGQVAKIYARKPLIITCDVSGTHLETIEHIVDSSKLCEIGDVVSFKEIGKEAPVSGRFTIKQHQNRQEKTLWSLRFWENVLSDPSEVMPNDTNVVERCTIDSVSESTRLSEREIERLSSEIQLNWTCLAGLLNIPSNETDGIAASTCYSTFKDKAAQMLKTYNRAKEFSRKDLAKYLEEINLPDVKENLLKGDYRKP